MATLSHRKLRVFLSYASQDKPVVRKLYQKLLGTDWIDPWLDEEKLFPGQDWNVELDKAVEDTDAVIVCLSKGSVSKEGHVQKEISIAMNKALEKPLYTTFIIPLRLDDCVVPRKLAGWHYADFFPVEKQELAFFKLLAALVARAIDIGLMLEDSISAYIEKSASFTQGDVSRVFISYSRKDVEFVKILATDLQTVRLDVWWDITGLRGGNNWVQTIQGALDRSKYCVVVISPDSMLSPWVEKEYNYAMNNDKIVIPLFYRDCKLPFSFSNTQYVDFRDKQYRAAMYELYTALDRKVG